MRPAAKLSPAPLEIGVIGAGNLGLAQAGHLASLGHAVRLYNRGPERLSGLRASGEIRLAGLLTGAARPALATTDLAEAVAGAALLFVDVPATAHAEVAAILAPHLRGDAPLVVLHPGQTFGAFHFAACLRAAGLADPPPICELQTAVYTSRLSRSGEASVLAIKRKVAVAVLPRDRSELAAPLRELYPQLIPAPSTLHTGLANLQGLIHPAACLFNLARIDRGEPFRIYREGLGPAIDEFLEQADRERLSIAAALGVRVPTAAEWFGLSYGVEGRTVVEAMEKVEAYEQLLGSTGVDTRLLWEDVPTGLVPLLSIAEALGLPAPTLRSLRDMAVAVCGDAVVDDGWTLERLGLSGLSPAELRKAF